MGKLEQKELMECPFCGGEAVMMDFLCAFPNKPELRQTRYIGCRGAGCCVVSFNDVTRGEAVARWNRRGGGDAANRVKGGA